MGGTGKIKKWSMQNFAKTGNYLKKQYGYDIVLCGAQSDEKDVKKFLKYYDGDVLNLTGKTSLIDLSKVIYFCNFILSNDTVAPHIAASLQIKNIFVIYNGNHYGRFIPYPKEITKDFHIIYHPFIFKNLNNYKKLSNSYGFKSNLDINEISYKMVKDKINQVMNDL